MYRNTEVIDGHIHYCLDIDPEYFVSLLDRTGTDRANLAVITHGERVSSDVEALALKYLYPERFFVFASLDRCLYYRAGERMGELQAEHAKRLIDCGADGIKLLEGKPQLRRALPIPDFDDKCWEGFWSWCEEEQVPILWHVNDPENFWDAAKVPVWAAAQGWLYDDSFVNNEAQYSQVLNVLSRHPSLRIDFAHFFFMSAQLPRLRAIMEKYENVRIDLTPGIELYENLSLTGAETRRFFDDFHERIIYGTDIGSRFVYNTEGRPFNEKENLRRPEIVRDFIFNGRPETISSDGNFLHDRPDFVMDCLGLTGERLREVMSLNFLRFIGRESRPVGREKCLEECALLRERILRASSLSFFTADYRGVDGAEAIFREKI